MCWSIRLSAGVFLAVMAGIAGAAVSESGKISRLVVEGDRWVSVYLDGPDNSTECSGGGRWTVDRNDDPLFNQKVSVLLAAATSKTTVGLLSATTCGAWSSNKIYYIDAQY